MSCEVVLHCGRYVLFGLDTRETLHDPDDIHRVVETRDGTSKLSVHARCGLIAGTGYLPLLRAVAARLPSATDTAELLAIIDEERQRVLMHPAWPEATKQWCIDSTGWLFSFGVPDDPQPRVLMYHQLRAQHWFHHETGHAFFRIGAGNGSLWLPDNGEDDHSRVAMHEELSEQLRTRHVCEAGEPIDDSLTDNVGIVLRVMHRAADQIPESINHEFEIGLHCDDGYVEIFKFFGEREAPAATRELPTSTAVPAPALTM